MLTIMTDTSVLAPSVAISNIDDGQSIRVIFSNNLADPGLGSPSLPVLFRNQTRSSIPATIIPVAQDIFMMRFIELLPLSGRRPFAFGFPRGRQKYTL